MVNQEKIQKAHDILCHLLEGFENNIIKLRTDDDARAIIAIQAVAQTLGYVLELPDGNRIKNAILDVEAAYFAQGIEFKKV